MTLKTDRRTLLKMLAATGVGATLPWLKTQNAFAQSADEVPLRVLFLSVPEAPRRTTWEPSGYYLATPPSSVELINTWDLRGSMAQLAPYQSRMNMFENLDMVSDRVDPTGASNAHAAGGTHALTAISRQSSSSAGGQSIDLLIAEQLNGGVSPTRLRSLLLSASENSSEYAPTDFWFSYAAAGQPAPYIAHPPDAWNHIFPFPLDSGSAEDAAFIAATNARNSSIFNLVRGEFQRLAGQLGTEDRSKIEQMLNYRSELQSSLFTPPPASSRDANRPDETTLLAPYYGLTDSYQQGNMGNRRWSTKTRLMSQMVAAALHTDTTRVAHLALGSAPDYEFGYQYSDTDDTHDHGTSDAHDLSHQVCGDEPTQTGAAAQATHQAQHDVTWAEVRYLLDHLDSLGETDGQSLLDHTLVVIYSHIGEGSHDLTRLPFVLIGDAHGALNTGNYVRNPLSFLGSNNPSDAGHRRFNIRGRPHNDLWVTVANAMGIPITSFGNSSIGSGAITEILNT